MFTARNIPFLKGTCILLLVWLAQSLTMRFGLVIGVHSFLLTWCFFILCTPITNGSFLLSALSKHIRGKSFAYTELFLWLIATLFNLASFIFTPSIYFKTKLTHLLFLITAQPRPLWIIFFLCALSTIYSSIIAANPLLSQSLLHRRLCQLLTIASILITMYLSYYELVFVLNSHGSI